jgi:RNA polymerase sigma-70 factor (ECF subfamily)
LAETYQRYAPLLYSAALRVAAEAGAAEDCVHDVVLRAWERGSYHPRRGSLRAFLVVATRNEALTRMRSAHRQRRLLPRLYDPSAAADPAAYVQASALHETLYALPPDQRDVIERAYFGQHTREEIAGDLGVPIGTVKSRLHRALAALATLLKEDAR